MPVDLKNGTGGSDAASGGSGDNKDTDTVGQKPSTVTREAYENVLTEKKKLKERLDALDADSKKRQESELVEKQEFKKLHEASKAEAEEWKNKFSTLDKDVKEGRKLNAFLQKVPGKVSSEYWSLIDLEKVAMDPETGVVDESSLVKAVKAFEEKHSRLIDKPNSAKLPNDAAKSGATGKLSYEEWKKLPLDDQKKRMKDVDKSTI